MRVLSAHSLVRALTIALMLWVNVDVGFCSACAFDPLAAASSGPLLVSGGAPRDATPSQLPHPTHCFYHAHWVDIPSSVTLTNSAWQSGTFGETSDGVPETPAQTLDHPPRLQS
jgi:hypothetical protein